MSCETFAVRLEKDYLVFSAAHFITFNGQTCERLHGHNYRVAAEIHGPLDENAYVIDFIALRDTLKLLVDELDHSVLLPTQHAHIHVAEVAGEVVATFAEKRWVFPRGDCRLLPVPNTTAEMLAQYLGGQLLQRVRLKMAAEPLLLRVAVDENCGQWGEWVWRSGPVT